MAQDHKMRLFFYFITLFVTTTLSCDAFAADESLIAMFMAKREALVAENRIDIPNMSTDIRNAVNEGERLERAGQYGEALQTLSSLERYTPLLELPSFDVQMLSSWLHMKLGDSGKAGDHKARADAMRDLLLTRIGKGASPEDPIRAIMNNEVIEWTRMQLASISDVESQFRQGREILAVAYSSPRTGQKTKVAYFEIDSRVREQANRQLSLFTPIPFEQMRQRDREAFDLAKMKREKFLSDEQFPYLELLEKAKSAALTAAQLDTEGKTEKALDTINALEAIRPIEDIPLTKLIATYSALMGKLGNSQKQTELRALLFGINQVIAHSGDGLSAQTAVHVIAVEEEYIWLDDKKLNPVKQSVMDAPEAKFDVITAKDPSGVERDYYFNITRLYSKYGQLLKK
jgi:hypothetical protein